MRSITFNPNAGMISVMGIQETNREQRNRRKGRKRFWNLERKTVTEIHVMDLEMDG